MTENDHPEHAGRAVAAPQPRPHVCVIDLAVVRNSPVGSCVLAEVLGLAGQADVTILSAACEPAARRHVRWLRLPMPQRPLVLRYALFHLAAPIALAWHRLRGRLPPVDWVQASSGQYARADIVYAHFCHRAYLAGPWRDSPARGLRRLMRYLNHRFNAFTEGRCLRHARCVVVPSRGLARELQATYPHTAGRIVTLANPVDLEHFRRPAGYDRTAWRGRLDLPVDATLFSFVALGDFDRKGLGLVLAALAAQPAAAAAHLIVVGGRRGEVADWVARAEALGVGARVHFVGLQDDVRPYLWASDVYVFPSAYEIFSLAILQAAAAALPVIVSRGLYGAEEFVVDGHNGWLIQRSAAAVAAAMREAIDNPARRDEMGREARRAVQCYGVSGFVQRWREVFLTVGEGSSADAVSSWAAGVAESDLSGVNGTRS